MTEEMNIKYSITQLKDGSISYEMNFPDLKIGDDGEWFGFAIYKDADFTLGDNVFMVTLKETPGEYAQLEDLPEYAREAFAKYKAEDMQKYYDRWKR